MKKTKEELFAEYCTIAERLCIGNVPNANDKDVRNTWMNALENITVEEFAAAMTKIIYTNKFFPSPSEIFAAIPRKEELSGSEAWDLVQAEMNRCMGSPSEVPQFTDKGIIDTINAFGGLNNIWHHTTDYVRVRQNFIKMYEQLAREEKSLIDNKTPLLEG